LKQLWDSQRWKGSLQKVLGKEDLPLQDWIGGSSASTALVFTDTVRSTEALFRWNTRTYMIYKRAQLVRVTALLADVPARPIDAAGDSLFLVFRAVTDALEFSRRFFADPGLPEVRVRIGLHYGSVTVDGSGLAGRAVHYAARVCQYGKDAELWSSDAAKSMLESESPAAAARIEWQRHEDCELKGIPDKHRLWRIA
jgi:class 3 adenylate cyclase